MPSGLAVTHVILKSYVIVADWASMPKHRRIPDRNNIMAESRRNSTRLSESTRRSVSLEPDDQCLSLYKATLMDMGVI